MPNATHTHTHSPNCQVNQQNEERMRTSKSSMRPIEASRTTATTTTTTANSDYLAAHRQLPARTDPLPACFCCCSLFSPLANARLGPFTLGLQALSECEHGRKVECQCVPVPVHQQTLVVVIVGRQGVRLSIAGFFVFVCYRSQFYSLFLSLSLFSARSS